MLHYTPPKLVEMNSSTLSPFARAKRFSTSASSHDKQPLLQVQDNEGSPNPKRTSRLNDFMSRARTASLPPRPHTSNGPSVTKPKLSMRLGNLKGKGKEKAESLSPDVDDGGRGEYMIGAAASSMTSGKHHLRLRFMNAACPTRVWIIYCNIFSLTGGGATPSHPRPLYVLTSLNTSPTRIMETISLYAPCRCYRIS